MALLVEHQFSVPSSSASGILSFLEESNTALQVQALKRIYSIVDVHWAEICGFLPRIEELAEDTSFPASKLAAAVASKCFYHLQAYNDALRLALSAGEFFDVSQKSEYIDAMLARCIDEYKSVRQQVEAEAQSASPSGESALLALDPRIEGIVEAMFHRCYADGCFEQALGVALDTYRIDKVDEVCTRARQHARNLLSSSASLCGFDSSTGGEPEEEGSVQKPVNYILDYAFRLCRGGARSIPSRRFRLEVISILVSQYKTQIGVHEQSDYSNICFGLQCLDQPGAVAIILKQLCEGSLESHLQALQICFDMQESENQGFVIQVVAALQPSAPVAPTEGSSSEATGDAAMQTEAVSSTSDTSDIYKKRLSKLMRILLEGFDVDLHLNFLFKQSHSDLSILTAIKQATSTVHNGVLHNATVVSHGFMQCGTTIDSFLRDNLDWLGKANNWAKFTAVSSIGVVHKGHVHESMSLLAPYLPQAGQSASPYSEAGALYALGLIHANKGGAGDSTVIRYLSDALKNSGTNDTVQHGACLGVGLAAMATADADIFESLRQVLFTDNAVAGEGAALSIGLLMIGQSHTDLATTEIPNLLNQAHDSPHEKIVRALALSIAMFVYGKEESADVIIEQLTRDRDPLIRYGGMYAIGMAYIGTGDNGAIKKLLHVAVSDVNDDVRRAAVMCLGFVSFRNPETVPKLVSLLAESFNPHVRYGACLAVGIACAGNVSKDALDLLTPMLEDEVDFVRQGALIATALVLQQVAEARSPSVKKFRELLTTVVADKYQPAIAKSGAILAAGILDAGGRNVVLSLQSRAGFMKMGAAVGVLMFLQYWYWYPLMNMLSLAFSPTVLIGLNEDFDMPTNFSVFCNTPASVFAYPSTEAKKSDEKKMVATAVLSTTAKAKIREARKEARKGGRSSSLGPASPSHQLQHSSSSMDVTEPAAGLSSPSAPTPEGPSMERINSLMSTASYISVEEVKQAEAIDAKPKKDKEAPFFVVSNPSRVVPSQAKYLSLKKQATSQASTVSMDIEESATPAHRYQPVDLGRRACPIGIIMLINSDPNEPEDVVKIERVGLGAMEEDAEPPAPFEWDPNDE